MSYYDMYCKVSHAVWICLHFIYFSFENMSLKESRAFAVSQPKVGFRNVTKMSISKKADGATFLI